MEFPSCYFYNITTAHKPVESPRRSLVHVKDPLQRRGAGTSCKEFLTQRICRPNWLSVCCAHEGKVPSGDRTGMRPRSFIATHPAMRLIGSGPRRLEMAQRRELGSLLRPGAQHQCMLINIQQQTRARKSCASIGSAKARKHKPSGAPVIMLSYT